MDLAKDGMKEVYNGSRTKLTDGGKRLLQKMFKTHHDRSLNLAKIGKIELFRQKLVVEKSKLGPKKGKVVRVKNNDFQQDVRGIKQYLKM